MKNERKELFTRTEYWDWEDELNGLTIDAAIERLSAFRRGFEAEIDGAAYRFTLTTERVDYDCVDHYVKVCREETDEEVRLRLDENKRKAEKRAKRREKQKEREQEKLLQAVLAAENKEREERMLYEKLREK